MGEFGEGEEMEKKSSVTIIILAGLFFSAGALPIVFYLLFTKQFIWYSVIPSTFYISSGIIVIRKWHTLKYWQKGSLAAIGIQYILLLIRSFTGLDLAGHQMSNFIYHLWNILGNISRGIPLPLSLTFIEMFLSRRSPLIVMVPPSVIASSAFITRFRNT